MKKTFIALVFSFIFLQLFNAGELKAQAATDDSGIIIIRSYEASMSSSEIIISYGNGKTESVELENLNKNNREKNLDKINQACRKVMGMGYDLISSSSAADGTVYTTCIFKKKKM